MQSEHETQGVQSTVEKEDGHVHPAKIWTPSYSVTVQDPRQQNESEPAGDMDGNEDTEATSSSTHGTPEIVLSQDHPEVAEVQENTQLDKQVSNLSQYLTHFSHLNISRCRR